MLGEMGMRRGTRSQRTGSVPPEASLLVGRQREIADAKRLIGGARLVTMTGPGGAGKTRLARQVGTELGRVYADGVWLVDLAELHDGSLVEYAVADALAIGGQTDQPLSRLLRDYLGDRELLLILDNCERVLDACAATVDRLLRSAPGLSVLCTSRQPLGMVGEVVRTVSPLAVPPTTEITLAQAAAYPALTLFADRAATVLPGFVLNASNVCVVTRICQQLDGLPLAIELAVAQLRSRSLEELASGLGQSFPWVSHWPVSPAHHARLHDTLDWSFGMCSAAERALWTRLSVFAGFDLAGATAVCSGDDLPAKEILDTLAGLVDKSIVLREEKAGPVRYRLLETVRQYGLEQLDEVEAATLQRRHRDWYLALAERFDAEWFGAAQRDWAARIRAEYGNLRLALGWCLDTPGEAACGARLASALRYHWIGGGALVEGRLWLKRALAAHTEPTPERVRALAAHVRVLVAQMNRAESAPCVVECVELARRLSDPALLALATSQRAFYTLRCGDGPAAAQPLLEEALARYSALAHPDLEGATVTRASLAMALLFQGETARAAALCAEAREICVAAGERWCRSHALVASALVAQAQDRPGEARGYLRDSLPLRESLGDTLGLAISIEVLAGTAAMEGESIRAATLRGAGRRVWHDLGIPGGGSREYDERDQRVATRLRTELGDSVFEAAFQDGWKLSLDEAVAYALETGEPTEPLAGPEPVSPLTPREGEVAQLVAEGLSNKQIAARLLISQRTAESHVENILAKLGFASRTQIAAWAARRHQS
jgi:non-specific serine/threonine protein kinase